MNTPVQFLHKLTVKCVPTAIGTKQEQPIYSAITSDFKIFKLPTARLYLLFTFNLIHPNSFSDAFYDLLSQEICSLHFMHEITI